MKKTPRPPARFPAASLAALALVLGAARAPAQFDFGGGGGGGGSAETPAYEAFKLNPKTRIKLDFRNANVDQVLALFQKTSGVTIVKDPALTGTVTLTSAKAVGLKEAFQILATTLGLKNFELRKEGNLLVIAQRQPRDRGNNGGGGFPGGLDPSVFQQPESQLRVYPIKYANSSQVARVINDVFGAAPQAGGGFPGGGGRFGGGNNGGNNNGNNNGGGGRRFGGFGGFGAQTPQIRASSDDFSNSVIVNAPSKQQRDVSDLIKQIDKETDLPQRSQTYRLVYATAADTATVVQNVLTANAPRGRGGATTQQQQQQNLPFFLRGANAQGGQGQVVPDVRTNTLVVTATEDNQRIVASLVKELDQPVETASTTFVIPLSNARADDIATLLNNAFGTRAGLNGNRNGNRLNTPQQQRQNTNANARNAGGLAAGRGVPQAQAQAQARVQSPDGKSTTTLDLPVDETTGELQTNISVAQGGGFGFFNGGGFGGNQQNRPGQGTNQTARDANGRIVNVSDLTNQITVIPDNNTNSVVVVASPEGAKLIGDIINQLDRIPEQVMIETIIVEATLDDTTKLGVEFGLNIPNVFGLAGANVNGATGFGLQNANPPLQGGRVTLSGGNLTGFVNALRTDSRFNILSTPRIFTTNNQQAQINISQSIPYVLSTRQDINGGLQFNYAFQDVGIVLTVTPRITSNGYVTMDVSQTANDLQGFTSFNAPIVNQREADTTVSVLDGETIVLGGIIRNTVTATTNKVPLLGDIPLLGNIFRSTTKTNNKTELLVLLTPRIVRDDADARRLRDAQQSRLSKPTQAQLKGIFGPGGSPADVTPGAKPVAPPPDPGSGAGTPPGKKTDPPRTDPPKTDPPKTDPLKKTPPPSLPR